MLWSLDWIKQLATDLDLLQMNLNPAIFFYSYLNGFFHSQFMLILRMSRKLEVDHSCKDAADLWIKPVDMKL